MDKNKATGSGSVSTKADPATIQSLGKRPSHEKITSYSPEKRALTRSTSLTTATIVTTQPSSSLHTTSPLSLKELAKKQQPEYLSFSLGYLDELDDPVRAPVVTASAYTQTSQPRSDIPDTISINSSEGCIILSDSDIPDTISRSSSVECITLSDSENGETIRNLKSSSLITESSEIPIDKDTRKKTINESGSAKLSATASSGERAGNVTLKGISTPKQLKTHVDFISPCLCEHCGEIFTVEAEFANHMFRKHGEKIYMCEHCPNRYSKKDKCRDHQLSHKGIQPQAGKCKYCGYYFKYLNRHQQRGSCQALKQNIVDLRTKAISSKSTITATISAPSIVSTQVVSRETSDHGVIMAGPGIGVGLQDTEKQAYLCKYCDKSFISEHLLNKHNVSAHNETVSCKHCGKVYIKFSYLKKHETNCAMKKQERELKQKQEQELRQKQEYSCIYCYQSIRSYFEYIEHLRWHKSLLPERNKEYICAMCDMEFDMEKLRNEHERDEHKIKSIVCKLCDLGFSTSGIFKLHQRKHHPDSQAQNMSCESCGKLFKRPLFLKRHQKNVRNQTWRAGNSLQLVLQVHRHPKFQRLYIYPRLKVIARIQQAKLASLSPKSLFLWKRQKCS